MSLRAKLTAGLGFLFAIIFALSFYSVYDIQRLSTDSDRILRDNYDSLVYCRNMLAALDDMRTSASQAVFLRNPATLGYLSQSFGNGKSNFDASLSAEQKNITEPHEGEYVAQLVHHYGLFLSLCRQAFGSGSAASSYFNDILPAYSGARQAIVNIDDVNMQAIERKNVTAKHNASTMITSFAVVGAILVILAFFYFWYFPFYVSNTVSYLSNKMTELLKNAGMSVDIRTNDEAFILLQSINLLEHKLTEQKGTDTGKRKARTRP